MTKSSNKNFITVINEKTGREEYYRIVIDQIFKDYDALTLAQFIDTTIKENITIIDSSFLSFYDQELQRLRYRDAIKNELQSLNYYQGKLTAYETKLSKFNLLLDYSLQQKLIVMYNEWKHKKTEWLSKNGKRSYSLHYNIDVPTFYEEESEQIEKLISLKILSLRRAKILLAQQPNWESRLKNTAPQKPQMSSDVLTILSKSEPKPVILKDTSHDIELLAEIGLVSLKEIVYAMARTWGNSNCSELKMVIQFNITHWCNSNTKGDGDTRKQEAATSGKSITNLLTEYQTLFYKLKTEFIS